MAPVAIILAVADWPGLCGWMHSGQGIFTMHHCDSACALSSLLRTASGYINQHRLVSSSTITLHTLRSVIQSKK